MLIRVINKIFIFLLLAFTLTACSHDDQTPTPGLGDEMPMHFTSSVATPITRAATLLHDNNYETFGVWTWRQPYGASTWEDVMRHYRVSYDAKYIGEGRTENGWGYDKEIDGQVLKYWNLNTTVYEFKGYAPFTIATGDDPHVTVNGSREVHFLNISGHYPAFDCMTAYPDPSDPEYNTKKANIDWVHCYGKRTFSPLPDLGNGNKFDKDMLVPPTGEFIGDAISKTSTVPLRFHHLLPKVIFRIHVYDPEHIDDEQLLNIGIDIKANTVTKDADVQYGTVETYGTAGNTNTPNADYMDHTSSTIPDKDHPTFISFHQEKNTDYRDLSPSIVTVTPGTGVVTYDKEGWMEVPQKAPTFTINMTVDGKPYSRTLNPSVDPLLPQNWESDHIYIYIIQFNVKSKTLDTTSYIEEWVEDSDNFELKDW